MSNPCFGIDLIDSSPRPWLIALRTNPNDRFQFEGSGHALARFISIRNRRHQPELTQISSIFNTIRKVLRGSVCKYEEMWQALISRRADTKVLPIPSSNCSSPQL